MTRRAGHSGWPRMAALALCLLVLLALAAPAPARASEGGSTAPDSSDSGSLPPEDSGEGEAGAEGEPPQSGSLFSPESEPQAAGVCLLNVDTGLFVYEKNADASMPAASTVKLMTCMLVAEWVEDFDNTYVTADKLWIYDALYGKNASTADIRRGETLSVTELLYATLLPSANEAALVLADYVCGGYMPNFLYMMNTRAKALGCTGTYFADANGLSEESVTTARDMALIMQAFLKYPRLVEMLRATTFQIEQHEAHDVPYTVHTTNRLLVQSSPYYAAMGKATGNLIGGKTGSLGEWQNFISAAGDGDATYVCAVLHSPHSADTIGAELDPVQARPALVETGALYSWAFSTLAVQPVLDAGQPATEIRVRYSTQAGNLRLMPGADLKAVLSIADADTKVQRRYNLPEYLAAPIEAGQVVGTVTLTLGGQVIGSTTLTAERDVARNQTLYWLQRAGEALTSLYFRVLLVVVLVLAGLYVAFVVWRNNARQKKGPKGPANSRKMK